MALSMLERVVVTDSRSSTLTCLGVPFLDSCTPYITRLRLESGRGTGVVELMAARGMAAAAVGSLDCYRDDVVRS